MSETLKQHVHILDNTLMLSAFTAQNKVKPLKKYTEQWSTDTNCSVLMLAAPLSHKVSMWFISKL